MTRNFVAGMLLGCAVAASAASAQSIPVEGDAIVSDSRDWPRAKLLQLVDPGVGMIRAMGWRCDSLSAIRPHLFSRGFTIVCNRFNYEYEFKDRGGNWVVSLK